MRFSALTGIITGVSLTSDNLSTIAPERLALLGKAANIRMRDVKPIKFPCMGWAETFSGTIDGVKAAAILNESDEVREYPFEELGLDPEKEAEEILQDLGKRKYVISVQPHDAVILKQS